MSRFQGALFFFNTNYIQLFYLYTGLTPKIPRSGRAFQMFTKSNTFVNNFGRDFAQKVKLVNGLMG